MSEDVQKMPEIGTRVVHKDDRAKNQGPLWEVRSKNNDKNEIGLGHVLGHKANIGLLPEVRSVKVPEFYANYQEV